MPRAALPHRELEICARFRSAREMRGLTQAELATRVGIDGARLRNYEYQKNPLPYWIGSRIARETDCSQRWLATGQLPRGAFLKVDEELEAAIPRRLRFSVVYDKALAAGTEDALSSLAQVFGVPEPDLPPHAFKLPDPLGQPPGMELSALDNSLAKSIAKLMGAMPLPIRARFADDLRKLKARYIGKNFEELHGRALGGVWEAERKTLHRKLLSALKADAS